MKRIEKIKKNNTLVHSRTEEQEEPRSRRWILFLVLVLFSGLIYLVFYSNIFMIKKVDIQGYRFAETVEKIVNEEKNRNIVSGNLIFFNTGKIKNILLGDPRILDIKISRDFPDKITFKIEESKPAIIWNSAGDKYLVDMGGVIIESAKNEDFINVFDALNIKVKAGERVASPTFINFIKKTYENFEGACGAKPIKVTLFDLLTDVHILSSDGWTVYLDASKDSDSQLKNLARVLDEARKAKKKIQYIDLRIESRIFYK